METIAIHVPATPEITKLVEELLKNPGVRVDGYKDPNEFLTIREAAFEARKNYHTFRRMVVDRKLIKHSRPGGPKGNILIQRAELLKFLQGQKKPVRPGRKARGIEII